jgi:hypothetical protein
MRVTCLAALALGLWAGLVRPARGDVEVAVSSAPTSITLTAFSDADLTLARETRRVFIPAGASQLSVAWPGAAVDASSIRLLVPEGVEVSPASQPPQIGDELRWRLQTDEAGEREVVLLYFLSGIEWRPLYHMSVNPGTKEVELEGLVHLRNRSGQVFEGATLELALGDLPLISNPAEDAWKALPAYRAEKKGAPPSAGSGLSERRVYALGSVPRLSLEDTRVLPFFPRATIKADLVRRMNEAKYGAGVREFVVFENSEPTGLGRVPLARADVYVSEVTAAGPLPRGRVTLPYTALGEECEIDLGPSKDVIAERRVVERKRTNFEFDRIGAVEGYDDRQDIELEVSNWSPRPVAFEYTDTVPGVWDVASDAPFIEEGMNEVSFKLTLEPQTTQTLKYRLIQRQGRRVRLGPVRPK